MEGSSEEFDLSKYIAAEKLAVMSDLERRCANRIKNYEMMKEIGKTPYIVKIDFVNTYLCSVLYEYRYSEVSMRTAGPAQVNYLCALPSHM